MTGDSYTNILEHSLTATLQHYNFLRENIIFQQDNDPKHTSHVAKTWFANHKIKVLDWPPQPPDPSSIEHLWDYLKDQLKTYKTPSKGVHEL